MENEIMNNEEVFETTEDIVTENSNKAFVVAAGIGLALLVGTIAYRKVVKPFIAKRKAMKESDANNLMIEAEEVDFDSDDDDQ